MSNSHLFPPSQRVPTSIRGFTKCLPHFRLVIPQCCEKTILHKVSKEPSYPPKGRSDLSLILNTAVLYLRAGLCPLGFATWPTELFVHFCTAEGPCRQGEAHLAFASAPPTSTATSTKVCTSEVSGNVSVFGTCLPKLDGVQYRTFCPASHVVRPSTAGLCTRFSFPDSWQPPAAVPRGLTVSPEI